MHFLFCAFPLPFQLLFSIKLTIFNLFLELSAQRMVKVCMHSLLALDITELILSILKVSHIMVFICLEIIRIVVSSIDLNLLYPFHIKQRKDQRLHRQRRVVKFWNRYLFIETFFLIYRIIYIFLNRLRFSCFFLSFSLSHSFR